jgi:hypothetical protein
MSRAKLARPKRRPSLVRLFADLNARHFDGKLADWRAVLVSRAAMRRVCPEQSVADLPGGISIAHGYTDAREHVIYIRDGLGPRDTRRCLLHEMVHAATPDPAEYGDAHGPVWCAGMRRLAKRGEAWAGREAAPYDTARRARAKFWAPYFKRHPLPLDR